MRKPMEVYLSDLEWTKTHNNMGGVMGNIVFKDNMSYEEYRKLFKTTYFTLCDKGYITNLQKENEKLKEENKHIFANVNDDELLISNAMNYAEAQDYKSRVEKAIEDIEFCFRSIKQEADMSKDERTRHEMRTCLAIFNETLKSLKNGSDNNV